MITWHCCHIENSIDEILGGMIGRIMFIIATRIEKQYLVGIVMLLASCPARGAQISRLLQYKRLSHLHSLCKHVCSGVACWYNLFKKHMLQLGLFDETTDYTSISLHGRPVTSSRHEHNAL